MGRIKSLMIKRAGQQLLDSESNFTESFEHNKKLLKATMPSKSIRNKVAGYLSHLARIKKQKEKHAKAPIIKSEEIVE